MSSREPMWYCHECHAEMRPLLVPDPVCASCHSSFVEKIDDPTNDPRHFATGGGPGEAGDEDGLDNFLVALQTLLNRGMQQRTPTEQPFQRQQASSHVLQITPTLNTPQQPGSRVTFQFRSGSGAPRQTTFTWGNSSPPSGSPIPGAVPTMSEFVRSAPSPSTTNDTHNIRDGPQISGPLFAQYLMSLLGQTNHPLMPLFMGGMPESGRMGDYVFSQEALDQIITQIMESTNAHRPVPATEEIIEKLPREILEVGSPFLTRDCAVCKDQFQLGTEDPDEQIIITLPCKHPFHQPCIVPWLKSSGTCPVCRHALVPQPDQHASNNNNASSSPPFTSSSSRFNSTNQRSRARSQSPFRPNRQSSRSGSDSLSGSGIFASLFGNLAGHRHGHRHSSSDPTSPQPSTPSSASSTSRSSQQHQTSSTTDTGSQNRDPRSGQGGRPHVPGQWTDDMMDLD